VQEIKDRIIKDLEALKVRNDGKITDSLMAHLWINKCIDIVRKNFED
jgi:hypothetical protein